jgi:hypothetical protein
VSLPRPGRSAIWRPAAVAFVATLAAVPSVVALRGGTTSATSRYFSPASLRPVLVAAAKKPPRARVPARLGHVGGVVTSWPVRLADGREGFTLLGRNRRAFTVEVTRRASYREAGYSHPDISYVFPGVKLVLMGWVSGTGSRVVATQIHIAPDPARDHLGVVVRAPTKPSRNGVATFWMRNGRQVLVVEVFHATSYRERAVHHPGLADVTVGRRVVAFGPTGWPRTTIFASIVTIRHPPMNRPSS